MKTALKLFLIFFMLFSFCQAREDLRSYYNDIETPAVCKNPTNIKVYIEDDKIKGYVLERSFKAWDGALRSNLNFRYVTNIDDADISIKFVDKLTGPKAGVTLPQYYYEDGRAYLHKVKVEIAKAASDWKKFTDVQLNEITLHEIGHAIGVLGHSDSPHDIMYPQISTYGNTTLSTKDVDTVNKIYGF